MKMMMVEDDEEEEKLAKPMFIQGKMDITPNSVVTIITTAGQMVSGTVYRNPKYGPSVPILELCSVLVDDPKTNERTVVPFMKFFDYEIRECEYLREID
jgi:hypothetical protein